METRGSIRACVLFFMLSAPCLAQGHELDDSLKMEALSEVTVLSSRNTSERESISSLQEADAIMLGHAGAIQLSDAVKFFGGTVVKDYGGIGGLKTVSVRGLGATHTAVAVDGVLMNDIQSGQTDIGRLMTSGTGNVSLASGPGNDLLQTAVMAASASTLNVESARPEFASGRNAEASALVKGGSFNTWNAQVGTGFKIGENSALQVGAEWLSTDGSYPYVQDGGIEGTMLRENSDVQRVKLDATLFSDFTFGSFKLKAYGYSSEQGLPANILYNPGVATERLWNKEAFMQATLKSALGERVTLLSNAKYGLSHTRYKDDSVNNIAGFTDNSYDERELYLSEVLLYRLTDALSFTLAEDLRRSTLDGSSMGELQPQRLTLNSSIAAKYAVENLTATARMNHVITHDRTLDGSAADSYRRLSPQLGVNWKALGWLSLRTSFTETFRLPTFNDLYFEQIGRRDLKPERADMISVGAVLAKEYDGLSLEWAVDLYMNLVKDRILAVPGKNTAVWMMKNVGLAVTRGAESKLKIEGRGWGLQAAYTYQRSMDKTDADAITWNHQLPYVPRHSGSALAYLDTGWFTVSCSWLASGEYYSNSYNGPEYLMPSYSEVGAGISRDFSFFSHKLTVKAEGINLLDCRYELVRNYPMPGRQLRASLSMEL